MSIFVKLGHYYLFIYYIPNSIAAKTYQTKQSTKFGMLYIGSTERLPEARRRILLMGL
jgi:hypothetical protein